MSRQVFMWSESAQKVLPIEEARALDSHKKELGLANIKHGYVPDEMPPTKHPIDGRYYTSKAKFRAVTKAHGREEVGTAYENGYDPSVHLRDRDRESKELFKRELIERMNS